MKDADLMIGMNLTDAFRARFNSTLLLADAITEMHRIGKAIKIGTFVAARRSHRQSVVAGRYKFPHLHAWSAYYTAVMKPGATGTFFLLPSLSIYKPRKMPELQRAEVAC